MSIILGRGDELKDLHICNKVINKIVIGNKVVWQKQNKDYLTFDAHGVDTTIKYTINGDGVLSGDLFYSYDKKIWNLWTADQSISLRQQEPVYIWGNNTQLSTVSAWITISSNEYDSADIDCYGNVNSLINFNDVSYPYTYYRLFKNFKALNITPYLPTIDLGNAAHAYEEMFSGCEKLIYIRNLPATNIQDECYCRMFENCTRIEIVYIDIMSVGAYSCEEMFKGCSNLRNINLTLYNGDFNTQDYRPHPFRNWVEGVSENGTFRYNGSDTTRGASAIPQNWVVEPF